MNHSFRVSERDRVAHVDEDFEILIQCQSVDGLVPGKAIDIFHRIKKAAIRRFTHLVNWDDVRVLQPSSQNGFRQEFIPHGLLAA